MTEERNKGDIVKVRRKMGKFKLLIPRVSRSGTKGWWAYRLKTGTWHAIKEEDIK